MFHMVKYHIPALSDAGDRFFAKCIDEKQFRIRILMPSLD